MSDQINYNFNKQKHMAKRQSWSPDQDKLISSLISQFETDNKKIKWAQISQCLQRQNPDWNRTGKQCRERWLNHLRPCLTKTESIDQIDLQQLFALIRQHGKKWSLIAKELPGRTDNTIKNFFYAALRKGLRNLNLYNTEIRTQRRYKIFKQDLIDKLLSVHDKKKSQDLFISDPSVYQLADEIRQTFIQCSFDVLKAPSDLTSELEAFYERLNANVMQLCRICKFKKSKGRKYDDEGEKFEIFTRKLNKSLVKMENSFDSNLIKSQTTEERQIKIEADLYGEVSKHDYSEKSEPQEQMKDTQFSNSVLMHHQADWDCEDLVELSMVMDGQRRELEKNLFQLLSMPEQLSSQHIAMLY